MSTSGRDTAILAAVVTAGLVATVVAVWLGPKHSKEQDDLCVPNADTDVIVYEAMSDKVLRFWRAPVSAVDAFNSLPGLGRLKNVAGYDTHLGQQLGPGEYRYYQEVPGFKKPFNTVGSSC